MNLFKLKFFLLILVSCVTPREEKEMSNKQRLAKNNSSYSFEGSEPFWSLKIEHDSLFLDLYTDQVYSMLVVFSEKSTNGNTIGFRNNEICGIINESWDKNCYHAITDQDSLGYEIFFTFKSKTYKGCGDLVK